MNTQQDAVSQAEAIFAPRTQGESLSVNGAASDAEIARINLRGTTYASVHIVGDMVCRVYHDQNHYRICVSAKDHPGFEACTYEACGRNSVGMLAMNQMLEQMRADCEWLDSLPTGALLQPGQMVLEFLLTYVGDVFRHEPTDGIPTRLQANINRNLANETLATLHVPEVPTHQPPTLSRGRGIGRHDDVEHHVFVGNNAPADLRGSVETVLSERVVITDAGHYSVEREDS